MLLYKANYFYSDFS